VDDASGAIEVLHAYVTVVARRACDGYVRRRFPERTRLRGRVRYVLTHHPACRLDASADGQMCGLAAWPASPSTDDARLRLAQLATAAHTVPGLAQADLARQPLATWLPAALAWIGAPVELDALVSVLATVTGTAEPEVVTPDSADDRLGWDGVPTFEASHADRLEARSFLRWLWTEIRELPAGQRAALLLNLRDDTGGSVLPLLVLSGVAGINAVAAALDMTVPALRALWASLPIDDQTLAARMGLTRQQVINLRKSARLRLLRRSRRVQVGPTARTGDEQPGSPAIRPRPRASS
jgi:hypothetical protein